jgi:hypothetical protein
MFSDWNFGDTSTFGASRELHSMEARGYTEYVQELMSEQEREDVEGWSFLY